MVFGLLPVVRKNTKTGAALCSPTNGQFFSMKWVFYLVFLFSLLGGYPLRAYQWRLSLRSDFPKLSSLVFLRCFNHIDLPIFQSNPAALGEAREVISVTLVLGPANSLLGVALLADVLLLQRVVCFVVVGLGAAGSAREVTGSRGVPFE